MMLKNMAMSFITLTASQLFMEVQFPLLWPFSLFH